MVRLCVSLGVALHGSNARARRLARSSCLLGNEGRYTLVGRYKGIMSESIADGCTPLTRAVTPLPMGESICIGVEDMFVVLSLRNRAELRGLYEEEISR